MLLLLNASASSSIFLTILLLLLYSLFTHLLHYSSDPESVSFLIITGKWSISQSAPVSIILTLFFFYYSFYTYFLNTADLTNQCQYDWNNLRY